MSKQLQANEIDESRYNDTMRRLYKEIGGLSESTIPAAEESRKAALIHKIREEGY